VNSSGQAKNRLEHVDIDLKHAEVELEHAEIDAEHRDHSSYASGNGALLDGDTRLSNVVVLAGGRRGGWLLPYRQASALSRRCRPF
jgi:hypothetical protein